MFLPVLVSVNTAGYWHYDFYTEFYLIGIALQEFPAVSIDVVLSNSLC